jgi:hypothetical protein
MRVDFKAAAQHYADLGWKVFPLTAGSKLPAIKGGHGLKDATDDADQIEEWTRNFPAANIGIATGERSGVVVIDIDPRNGGTASMRMLAGTGKTFPPCPTVRTGNGGSHLYFAPPGGLGSCKDKLGRGIDVKSTGGYVVAPPSIIRPSDSGPGGPYFWVTPPSVSLPPLPVWTRELLMPAKPLHRFEPHVSSAGAARNLEGMAQRIASARRGERNNLLNWCAYRAGNLVRDGQIDRCVVERRLTEAALRAGLGLPEILRTLRSGIEAASFDKGRG